MTSEAEAAATATATAAATNTVAGGSGATHPDCIWTNDALVFDATANEEESEGLQEMLRRIRSISVAEVVQSAAR